MNREILFRGKRIDNGEWVYGSLMTGENPSITWWEPIGQLEGVPCYELDCADVDANSVGQYTGLKDCKARKIYERDIVRHAVGWVGKVHYIEGAFEIEAKHQSWPANYARCGKIEVIGNIDDSPEMLGGEAAEA